MHAPKTLHFFLMLSLLALSTQPTSSNISQEHQNQSLPQVINHADEQVTSQAEVVSEIVEREDISTQHVVNFDSDLDSAKADKVPEHECPYIPFFIPSKPLAISPQTKI